VNRPTLTHLAAKLRREQQLVAHTVYECPSRQERFLGQRRCGDCNLWCSKVGLGGQCSGCDDILTATDLIGFDLNSREVHLSDPVNRHEPAEQPGNRSGRQRRPSRR
jgi:hypothetical protein